MEDEKIDSKKNHIHLTGMTSEQTQDDYKSQQRTIIDTRYAFKFNFIMCPIL